EHRRAAPVHQRAERADRGACRMHACGSAHREDSFLMSEPDIKLVDKFGRQIKAQDTAHFAASRRAREFAQFNPPLLSADAENFGELSTIAARALDMDRNNPIASGAINTNVDNIVGTGLRLA